MHPSMKRPMPVFALVGLLATWAPGQDQECALDALLRASGAAARTPTILDAWKTKYPSSTIPARMEAQVGLECYTCHDPSDFGSNCYRADLLTLIQGGSTIEDALDALDGVDSDGDGVPNGVEATTPRNDSADIGYNMGLIGPTGTNPCGFDPQIAITGVPETPPGPIPTVSQWGLLMLCLLSLSAGSAILVRRARSAAV